jgi:pimeloyl-ACP methyl ester carboxylesterase
MESVRDVARYYLWFIDEVGLDRPAVIGHSMGGWITAEMATMNPHALDRLVLLSAAGLKPEQGEILDIFYYPIDELRKKIVLDQSKVPEWEEIYGGEPTPEQADLALRNREMSARLTWRPYMFNPRLPYFLPRVTNSTLALWGTKDEIVPAVCGEQYARLLPNATYRALDNCGHFPQLEHIDDFVRIVGDFLDAPKTAPRPAAGRGEAR